MWKWFTQTFMERGFFPDGWNVFHASMSFYLIAGIGLAIAAWLLADKVRIVCGVLAGLLVIISVVTWSHNLNDHSGSYAGATTFIVDDTGNMPSSLKLLADGASSSGDCDLNTNHDMRGCINEGKFNFEWDARVASATGADKVISRSSGGTSNTKLMSDTLTYVYGIGEEGAWTAIRDGKSKTPIYGIASWEGQGNATICRFEGQYELNKAFSGKWGRNLSDEIAGKYTNLFYDGADRWGYCDNDEPVIVIPVKEQINYAHRTTFRAAGVLVITGSPSGDAQIKHVTDIKRGDFPGPVYPASLAKEQRESMGMIAGISNSLFRNFGYEPTDVKTQSGNASEFLLRNKVDDRVYWVTPMKPRSSDDQVLGAYSVVAADETTYGSLNDMDIYVLPDNDPRAVNLDDLEARVKEAISRSNPGFFSVDGSRIAEFLPLNDETWQVYAEISGRVVYRVTVPTDSRIRPTVASLDTVDGEVTEPGTPTGLVGESACVDNLSTLSDKQLAQCLSDIAKELSVRNGS